VSLLDLPVLRGRAPGIDFLRGLFAVWVLLAHLIPWAEGTGNVPAGLDWLSTALLNFFQRSGGSHPGVLGFIVLSGYCIHRNGFRWDSFHVDGYAIRRLFRIWPVFLLAVAIGVGLFLVSHHHSPVLASTLTATPWVSAKGVLLKLSTLSSLVPQWHVESFQGNAPLVTVAAEMWLYAVYGAVAVFLLRRRLDQWIWIGVGIVWIAGIVWLSRYRGYQGWWDTGSLFGFLPYWWLGAKFTDPGFWGRRGDVAAAAAVAFVAIAVAGLLVDSVPVVVVELRKALLALVIGWAIVQADGPRTRALDAGARLGQAGYSIYAFHAPVIVVLLIYGVPWPIVALAAIAFGVVAFLVYERPIMRYGAALGRRVVAARGPGAARASRRSAV
jgi:peptidoglycan/LPS O-acetylase OafA/YrhL